MKRSFVAHVSRVALVFLTSALAHGLVVGQSYEAGILTTNQSPADQWYDATFSTSFDSAPVVVLGPLQYNGVNPTTLRVRNVTTTGFQYKMDEWDYLDGTHASESFSYFALEPGIHTIGGLTWEAGRTSGVNQGWQTVSLSAGLGTTPVVMAQIESTNNVQSGDDPEGLVSRLQNVSGASFQVRINDEEASTTAPVGEDVGFIAVEEGSGWINGQPLLITRTGNVVTSNDSDGNGRIEPYLQSFPDTYANAVMLGAIQTADGGDPCALRYSDLTSNQVSLYLEEEDSDGLGDLNHSATEDIGFVLIGEPRGPDDAKIEVGALVQAQSNGTTWYTVNLQNTYTNPVVVLGPVSQHGADPSVLRVQNVTANSFEWQLDEWDYKDPGGHIETTQHYMVMEAGVYEIGGLRWEAGVASGITNAISTVNLADAQPVSPTIMAQVATTNEASAVSPRLRDITSSSFRVGLDEEQLGPDDHAAEDVHYIAMQPGPAVYSRGGQMLLFDVANTGNTISDEGANNEAQVAANGIDFQYEAVSAPRTYDALPFLLAEMQTENGGDPSALRYNSLSTSGFSIRVEEEQSEDLEVDHTNEVVGYALIATYTDSDGDELPDSWELANSVTSPTGDADSDGISNLDEFLYNSDPNVADVTTIAVSSGVSRAYELDDTNASFNITRTGSLEPVTVYYTFGGGGSASQPEATESVDFKEVDAGGGALAGFVTLPRFIHSAEVFIDPETDAIHEYPELVRLNITSSADYVAGGSGQADVDIADATDIAANETLFVGFYASEGPAVTSASGITTVILNGSNTQARINNSFTGLTTPQTNSHVHKANPGPSSGTIVESITVDGTESGAPLLGQIQNYVWDIEAAAAGTISVKTIIDSLYNQFGESRLYVNVHSVTYGSGEIWALLSEAEGSTEPPSPPSPPTITQFDLSTAQGQEDLRRDVARFLTQATFGPTQQTVEELYQLVDAHPTDDRITVYEQWIDSQFALDQTLHLDYTIAADWQEWVLRKHFQPEGYPAAYYTGGGTMPTAPAKPASWPIYTGPDLSTFDSLNQATWRFPSDSYPLTGAQTNIGNQFTPDLGEVNHNHRRRASFTIWANAHDQLRQRMGFAWQEIMVTSEALNTIRQRHAGAARWIDMLAENADDNFREMLEDVTYSPIMGKYLSHLRNASEAYTGVPPDENYAREIMQLFSIGLVELWQDGTLRLDPSTGIVLQTYDNNDITELAKVLTGLSFSLQSGNKDRWDDPANNTNFDINDGNKYYGARYEYPMKMFGDRHDTSVKTIVGGRVIDNTSAPDATAQGTLDIADMHDWLGGSEGSATYDGHESTPPFISYRLIQRLVTSNPSNGYVYRVAQVFNDTNGDLGEVTKAILLDYEARSLELLDDPNYGKMKEPLLRYIQALRGLNAGSELLVGNDPSHPGAALTEYGYPASQADNFLGTIDYNSVDPFNVANNNPGSRYRYGDTTPNLQQSPLAAPTVFNWFLPDFRPDGPISNAALVAPEFQITTETSVIQAVNYFWTVTWQNAGQGVNVLGSVNNANVTPPFTPQLDLGFTANGENIIVDRQAWIDKYDASTGTESERDQALVDELDLLLTGGVLKATYVVDPADDGPNGEFENPREVLINVLTDSFGTGTNGVLNKVRTAFYLITTTPAYIIQR
ncbi:MAG: DUF1800 family protein [Verrucomicrobiota bacterium]